MNHGQIPFDYDEFLAFWWCLGKSIPLKELQTTLSEISTEVLCSFTSCSERFGPAVAHDVEFDLSAGRLVESNEIFDDGIIE